MVNIEPTPIIGINSLIYMLKQVKAKRLPLKISAGSEGSVDAGICLKLGNLNYFTEYEGYILLSNTKPASEKEIGLTNQTGDKR